MDRICAALAVGIIIIIGMRCLCRDGFRSDDKKSAIADTLVGGGEPRFETLKNMGLDGAEYWSVRQLWHNDKLTTPNIKKIL